MKRSGWHAVPPLVGLCWEGRRKLVPLLLPWVFSNVVGKSAEASQSLEGLSRSVQCRWRRKEWGTRKKEPTALGRAPQKSVMLISHLCVSETISPKCFRVFLPLSEKSGDHGMKNGFPPFQALLSIHLCPFVHSHPWTQSDASLVLSVVVVDDWKVKTVCMWGAVAVCVPLLELVVSP